MKQIEPQRYAADPGEIITIDVTAERQPLLVAFQDAPDGTNWDQVWHNELSERRSFSMPTALGEKVRFAASFGEAIQPNDPAPSTRYTIKISGSHGGLNGHDIVLPKGGGSRIFIYEFETDYPGPS